MPLDSNQISKLCLRIAGVSHSGKQREIWTLSRIIAIVFIYLGMCIHLQIHMYQQLRKKKRATHLRERAK